MSADRMSPRTIHIFNRVREPLHAVFYSAGPAGRSEQKPGLIILCHGFKGDKSEKGRFGVAAENLNRHGFDVIAFDFTGSGENRRVPVRLSRQVADLEDVGAWAASNGYRTMGTLGLSFGGITSLMADLPFRKAAVFWSPAMYPKASASGFERLAAWVLSLMPFVCVNRPSSGPYPPIRVNAAFTREVFRLQPEPFLANFHIPALILQGDVDTTVDPVQTRRAFRQMPQDRHHRLVLVPGAAHDFNGELLRPFIDPSVAWFNTYL